MCTKERGKKLKCPIKAGLSEKELRRGELQKTGDGDEARHPRNVLSLPLNSEPTSRAFRRHSSLQCNGGCLVLLRTPLSVKYSISPDFTLMSPFSQKTARLWARPCILIPQPRASQNNVVEAV